LKCRHDTCTVGTARDAVLNWDTHTDTNTKVCPIKPNRYVLFDKLEPS